MPRCLSLLLVLAVWSTPAFGQVRFEILGARALGMGGAFVAVADDASSYHWNPAGTPKGKQPYAMTFGWDNLHFGDPNQAPRPGLASETDVMTSIVGSPAGFSYGYLKLAQVVGVREDGSSVVQALTVHHIGATYSQSLLPGLVVGATAKYLRGMPAIGESTSSTATGALGDALGLSGSYSSKFDLDAGVVAEMGPVRVGATMKNLLQPTFVGENGVAFQLPRLYRVGVAVLPTDGLTLAFDMDLDTADPLVGLRRMIAAGGEFSLGSSVALRGGLRWSRDVNWQPIWAAGASIRIYKGSWIDGYAIYSRDYDRGFGIAMRAGS
jgi:hypothetical protein